MATCDVESALSKVVENLNLVKKISKSFRAEETETALLNSQDVLTVDIQVEKVIGSACTAEKM